MDNLRVKRNKGKISISLSLLTSPKLNTTPESLEPSLILGSIDECKDSISLSHAEENPWSERTSVFVKMQVCPNNRPIWPRKLID